MDIALQACYRVHKNEMNEDDYPEALKSRRIGKVVEFCQR